MSSTQGQLLAKLRHDAQQVIYQQRGLHSLLAEWSEMEAEFQEIEALAMDEVLKSTLIREKLDRELKHAGYQDLGAQEWKPPLGKVPNYISEKCPKCFDTGGPSQACDCMLFRNEITTGKAFQMEPVKPGTMTQDEALGAVLASETEQDGCDTALDAVKQLREQTDTLEWREAYSDDAFKALNAELDALRQRASVPVKVRVSCSDDDLKNEWLRLSKEIGGYQCPELQDWCHEGLMRYRDYLASHAVIDAPAGVPSVEKLHDIGEKAYYRAEFGDTNRSRVVAIRDAILAGLAAEMTTGEALGGVLASEDEVEALARVLCDNWKNDAGEGIHNGTYDRGHCREEWNNTARAAIAHSRKRPEGLPTRDDIANIIRGEAKVIPLDAPMITRKADAILDAFTPYLRDPVGKPELDVTAEELENAWRRTSGSSLDAFRVVLDLCRSRIRPTFECKECAGFAEQVAEQARKTEDLERRVAIIVQAKQHLDAARAALEGE